MHLFIHLLSLRTRLKQALLNGSERSSGHFQMTPGSPLATVRNGGTKVEQPSVCSAVLQNVGIK